MDSGEADRREVVRGKPVRQDRVRTWWRSSQPARQPGSMQTGGRRSRTILLPRRMAADVYGPIDYADDTWQLLTIHLPCTVHYWYYRQLFLLRKTGGFSPYWTLLTTKFKGSEYNRLENKERNKENKKNYTKLSSHKSVIVLWSFLLALSLNQANSRLMTNLQSVTVFVICYVRSNEQSLPPSPSPS
jgi:hypothetical protein